MELQGDMTPEDWHRVLSDGAQLGCRSVQFIGGEPTMHPALVPLIRHARRLGYSSVEVFTNATNMADQIISAFREYGVSVACSFYSEDSLTHDRITGRNGSQRRTVEGIRRLLDSGIELRTELVEMPENQGHLGGARAFLTSLGVKRGGSDRLRGVGRGKRPGFRNEKMEELCGKCSDGRLCVTSSGDVFPCVFSRFCKLGDARNGLAAIVNGSALSTFRSELAAVKTRQRTRNGEALACNPYPCNPSDCRPGCSPEC